MSTNEVRSDGIATSANAVDVGRNTTYASADDLAQAMIRAANAHGEHEKRIGHVDPTWPVWYAEYMVREQSGEPLPE